MKIVLISSGYDYEFPHPACGGSEGCTERLAIGLNKSNYNFNVICAKRKEIKSYPFSVIETDALPEKYHIGSNYQSEAIDLAISLNPDLIITQSFHWKLNTAKCPVFVNVHGGGDGVLGETGQRENNVHFKFISKTQMERCIKNRPELGNNSFLCYTSLLNEDFAFEQKGEYFLWCASLFWGFQAKGLDLFIELSSIYPEYNFFAYGMGDGKIEKYLREEVEPNFINFKFKGFLDRYQDHGKVFSKAIAFCQFSRLQESFGRTTIEAMSKGVPIIHFDSGATPELVQDNGIFIKEKQQMVTAVKAVQQIDRKRVFEYSKKFHVDKEIETLVNYYNSIKK